MKHTISISIAAQKIAEGGWEKYLISDPKTVEVDPHEEISGIKVYLEMDVMDALFGEEHWKNPIPYEETGKAIQSWAEAHDSTIYAEPDEDFSMGEAAKKALEGEFSGVVVDNLS